MPREIFQFGEFRLDVADRRLERSSKVVRLSPKAFDILATLVRADGRLVTKRELLNGVWPDAFVEAGILTVHVSALRRTLGAGSPRGKWIETVTGAGYRFVGTVKRMTPPTPIAGAPQPSAEVRRWVAAGRAHLLTGSSAQMPLALSAFRAAVALDPTCASAHAGLALTRCAQAHLRIVPHAEAYADAKAAALRALAMDGDRSMRRRPSAPCCSSASGSGRRQGAA